ncbi:MAG: AsmA-like C-terminal region-containing protein [Xanthobacteraceae bacterium]
MQSTLLALGIAIIVALVTALVGPHFIDWSRYRAEFEAQSAWITGLEFRIKGRIEARLLPTPGVTLNEVEFGDLREGHTVRARAIHVEYAIGPLLRGEWRIDNAQLDGPELQIGLDGTGGVIWPFPMSGFHPQEIATQRLDIKNGRGILVSEAAASQLELEDIEFSGALQSLSGPVKGDGTVLAGGERYAFRLGVSRVVDGEGKLQLHVDRADRLLSADVALSLSIEKRVPRFQGNIAIARSAGRLLTRIGDAPLVVTSRVNGDSLAVALEQLELRYGADEEQALKLRGGGRLALGAQPQLSLNLSAAHVDLDRMFSLPASTRGNALAALKMLSPQLTDLPQPSLPLTLNLAVETLTFAGNTLQRLNSELVLDGPVWQIERFEVRAPGFTQVRLSGRLERPATGATLAGPLKIDCGDARALVSWLTDKADVRAMAPGAFRVAAQVSLGRDSVGIGSAEGEVDRMPVTGSLSYSWKHEDRPARIELALTTPELDLDRVRGLAQLILNDRELDRPQEGVIALKIGRVSVAGVEVKQTDVNMRIDARGLDIEQLEVADLGGIALAVNGRIDTTGPRPRGSVALRLDAASLKPAASLVEKLAPRVAAEARRLEGKLTPLSVRGTLEVDPGAADALGTPAIAKISLGGSAGSTRVTLHGNSQTAGAAKVEDLARLDSSEIDVSGTLDSDDGRALIELIGLEQLVEGDQRPGQLNIGVKGRLDGSMAVNARLAAGNFTLATQGMVSSAEQAGPSAALQIAVAHAMVRTGRPVAAGGSVDVLPASGTFGLSLSDGTLQLTDINGSIGGSKVNGRLHFQTREQPISFDGDVEVSRIDLAAGIGTGMGVPSGAAKASADMWTAEPFRPRVRGGTGQITLTAHEVVLTPNLIGHDFRGRIYASEDQLALQLLDGGVAGGKIAGELIFLRDAEAMITRSRMRLEGADVAELLRGGDMASGRIAVELELESSGLSPVALMGALTGSGRVTLTQGRLAQLSPTTFDSVIAAVGQGMPIDSAKVKARVESALRSGMLAVRRAEAGITIEGGKAQLVANPVLDTPDVDLAVTGSANLVDGTIDARLTLSALRLAGHPVNMGPSIAISLRGPIDAAARSIELRTFTDWLSQRAIEEQSKRLELLDQRESRRGPTGAVLPVEPATPGPRQPRRSPGRISRLRPRRQERQGIGARPRGMGHARRTCAQSGHHAALAHSHDPDLLDIRRRARI